MKKFISLLGCLVALTGCGSSKPEAKAPEQEVASTTKDVNVGSWTYTVPYAFEQKPSKKGLVSHWAPGKILMVSSAQEPYSGTLEELVTEKLNIITSDEFKLTILGSKNLMVDGTPGTILVAKSNSIFLITLVVVEKNNSFVLTCGGYMVLIKESIPVCSAVLSSVKHNHGN